MGLEITIETQKKEYREVSPDGRTVSGRGVYLTKVNPSILLSLSYTD